MAVFLRSLQPLLPAGESILRSSSAGRNPHRASEPDRKSVPAQTSENQTFLKPAFNAAAVFCPAGKAAKRTLKIEALRIEVSPERSLLLPHDQFMFAELTSGGDEQNLKLVFTAHEVSIRGHFLRRIETVMQRMELSLLAKISISQRNLITEGQPVVVEIVVTESSLQGGQPQAEHK